VTPVVCFKVTLALYFVLDIHDRINYIQFFTQEVSFLSGKVRTPWSLGWCDDFDVLLRQVDCLSLFFYCKCIILGTQFCQL